MHRLKWANPDGLDAPKGLSAMKQQRHSVDQTIGKFDAADFTVWRDHLGDGGGGQASSGVIPEPSTLLLAIMAALPCRFRGLRSSCCLCRNTP
jgi:hypothetical protein